MEDWIRNKLSQVLDFPVPDDLVQYILSIKNNRDLEDYMKTLIDFSNPNHKEFYNELIKNKNSFGTGSKKKKINKNQQEPSQNITENNSMLDDTDGTNTGKKKTKYINLYSQEGKNAQVVLLKGRHHCECQASKHALINNCLKCGRIVCKQEGSGPCLFCGTLVCTPEEHKEMNSKKSGSKLREKLMELNRPKGWEDAILHRNRLLEYDRTSERRTHVTDDDSDYFSSNSVWLSKTERERFEKHQQALQEKKHQSRRDKKMTFDFAGRQVIEEDNTAEVDMDIINAQQYNNSCIQSAVTTPDQQCNAVDINRDVAPGINPELIQFEPTIDQQLYKPKMGTSILSSSSRIQDCEIQEIIDTGKCMSMHQPWASLLVDGIKIHEGRSWYSNHRGRLWIASTVQQPDPETVTNLENMYRNIYPDKELKFPTFYPTGCLLGCVNVEDCLPQEEYRKRYPNGESDSPFVFICSNPISLRLRFPIRGHHKIYNMEKAIHQAAAKCIQRMVINGK